MTKEKKQPIPAPLMLSQDMLERLGKEPEKGDKPWLEPHDIMSIVADRPEMWTPAEREHALSLSRDSLGFAGLMMQHR